MARQITLNLTDDDFAQLVGHLQTDERVWKIFTVASLGKEKAEFLDILSTLPGQEKSMVLNDLRAAKAAREPAVNVSPRTPKAVSPVEALKIGQAAGRFVLTGVSDSILDLDRIDAAMAALHRLAYEVMEGTLQGQVLRSIFVATGQVQRGLRFGNQVNRARGPQKKALTNALGELPGIIADFQRDNVEYWRGFAREALAEVEDILEG